MKQIEINTGSHISKIIIGSDFQNLKSYLPDKKLIIITDENLLKYYGAKFPTGPIVTIGLGEKNKTFSTLELIFSEFLKYEVDRNWFVLAIGGGIVCDVAGFAASIYMRGLSVGFVSTSLLSQVDASVGGKNGVNFKGYKNMIGVFNQPEFVLCDPSMLETLPPREYKSGFAEIIKAGLIKDPALFEYLENNYLKAAEFESDFIGHIVYESVKIKANVVEQDEREKGERRKLNFGHTIAHSLEKITGMLHGEAVSIGMVFAAQLSAKLGLITTDEVTRIKNLCEKFELPTSTDLNFVDLFTEMKKDKKREGDQIHYVLLKSIGEATVESFSFNKLEELINDMC